ncbi:DNA-3-methyladenine glycosylase I [Candidatus Cytomitobacter primus]|uniref:DNA-3-methyladenine glycosylase I n=1 Tax=Candidatus Cytomitobacter primus TaxID=2066024 RepID=A0A5C0UFS0_9PROT|nr:DNA-3-methyladenine glycosylase I [Candidatus Cytomitobacter primus]QEK38483.1 DNA-3-methyladenine glycosylase I [Candidatus Cytomitobacter primus]
MERCFGSKSKIYADYHDNEWGVPLHDDRDHFELLILEGAHAGLSWEIVLNKRENYRNAFYNFDPKLVAEMTDEQLEDLLQNTGLIRNRLKIYSARKNAIVFLQIQKEFSSFDKYIWEFMNFKMVKNQWESFDDVPVTSIESDNLSKDLKKRGMSFVGSKIMYAYMQSAGMVNDHMITCPKWVVINEK